MRKFALSPSRLLALLALTGCNAYYNAWSPDDLMKGIPWFDHMIKSRVVSPYSRADLPRYTVPGTVPLTGGEADFGKEWKANTSPASFPPADRLMNPVPRDSLVARGDTLFHTFCAVCHGGAGAGDGPVNVRLGGAAKSLLTENARALSDGFIYSMIRYGRGNMPAYGDKIYGHADRWAVVNYVRQLQGKGTAPAPDSVALSASRPLAPPRP